jgi:AcrR family transcriptional regulator
MAANRRRQPQQERSRQTVERIVSAAARVLEREGDRAATTNRIAAEAGVSPGSLYQYFADRDDLLLAVTERFVAAFEARVVPALRLAAREDVVTGIVTVVTATLDAMEDRAPLLRALMARVPGDRQEEVTRALRARVTDFVFASTARHRPELAPTELERVTWMLVELAQTLPLRYVLDRPPIPRDVFVADTVRLLATHAIGGGTGDADATRTP